MPRYSWSPVIVAFSLCLWSGAAVGSDWPTFQHDVRRSGVTNEALKPPLVRQWTHVSRYAPVPAWGDPSPVPIEGNLELPRLRIDDAFHVAAVGDSVYFGSSVDHAVCALDASSGKVRWTTYTNGPIRLAPTVWENKVYVGSDDGSVYCLDTRDGGVIWQFAAAPHDEKVLGNGQLISLWPVRTGVLIDNGIAYFGAGVFPAEGLYLYAVKADSGELIWKNDTYEQGGMGELSPHGYLLASADRLFVPSGRCSPGVFSRQDGKQLYQSKLSWRRDGLFGGTYALLADDLLFNGTEQILAYRQDDGTLAGTYGGHRLVVDGDRVYLMTGEELLAVDRTAYPEVVKNEKSLPEILASRRKLREQLKAAKEELTGIQADKTAANLATVNATLEALTQEQDEALAKLKADKQQLEAQLTAEMERSGALGKTIADAQTKIQAINAFQKELKTRREETIYWHCSFPGSDSLILAGGLLYAGRDGQVAAIDADTGETLWNQEVQGRARGLAVANGRLLVSTDTGDIHCFAAGEVSQSIATNPPAADATPYEADARTRSAEETARQIVDDSAIKRGYALVLGGSDEGRLALALARRTELLICVAEPDPGKVAAARQALAQTGLYGQRVWVDQHDLSGSGYPDYFANLIVCADSFATGRPAIAPEQLRRMLKPHGGIAYVGQPDGAGKTGNPSDVQKWLDQADDQSTEITMIAPTWGRLSRGNLQGAGDWTHQYANAGNTTCGNDERVKGPLGILWFGEPGPAKTPNRHAANSSPLSVDGRLFVQGENLVRAYDAYNGLKLWEREIAGAVRMRMRGTSDTSNLAASQDSLFVVTNSECLRMDAAGGKTVKTYPLPGDDNGEESRWGYVAYVDGALFGSRTTKDGVSDRIFAIDVTSGECKWTHDGNEITHDSIAIGDGRVYLVENTETDAQRAAALTTRTTEVVDRKGNPDVRVVMAIDVETGKPIWERSLDVSDCVKVGRTGGDLTVMYSRNVLVLCGEPWNGHFWSEFLAGEFSRRSIITLAGDTGEPLWSDHIGYRSRPLIVGDTIYAEPWAHDLHTGKPKLRTNPITGQDTKWQIARPGHHCGCIAAAPNYLFFRSMTTAMYDLTADYGTCHYGAQRPGCWINFIPAGGLLLIPEASSGCVCPFALHCTIVMHPRGTNRVWGMYSAAGASTPVKHLAINFGAPGDRKDASGTLWLGYPRPYRSRLVYEMDLAEKIAPGGGLFRFNSENRAVAGADTPWIFSAGRSGLQQCTLPLIGENDKPTQYTVRLYFTEPDDLKPGHRVFNVTLQGKPVLTDFDIVAEAKAPETALVKEFRGIQVDKDLQITLSPSTSAKVATTILCGVEVVAE